MTNLKKAFNELRAKKYRALLSVDSFSIIMLLELEEKAVLAPKFDKKKNICEILYKGEDLKEIIGVLVKNEIVIIRSELINESKKIGLIEISM
jgi:hypothetical protein